MKGQVWGSKRPRDNPLGIRFQASVRLYGREGEGEDGEQVRERGKQSWGGEGERGIGHHLTVGNARLCWVLVSWWL